LLFNKKQLLMLSNKGTGAGGSNTNFYGKKFEEKTNNTENLINNGYLKNDYYLSKEFNDECKTITFVCQNKFKIFIKDKYKIDLYRCPDEAYIIEFKSGKKIIKILEKKEQRVEGSVETKLWSGVALKREYEIRFGSDFEISYAFCVNDFLKKKFVSNNQKYKDLNQILNEADITVLFGDDDDYFQKLNIWINNSL